MPYALLFMWRSHTESIGLGHMEAGTGTNLLASLTKDHNGSAQKCFLSPL